MTPIRAIGGHTRVVPSFVCSHSAAHLSGKARAGAGRQRLKVPIRKEAAPLKVKEELEPGASCNFGASDSSFGPSLKKGTSWRWRDVCQQCLQCPCCCNMATAAAAAHARCIMQQQRSLQEVLLPPGWILAGLQWMTRWHTPPSSAHTDAALSV